MISGVIKYNLAKESAIENLKQLIHGCLLVDIYLVNPNQAAINYYKMINYSKMECPVFESKLSLTPPEGITPSG